MEHLISKILVFIINFVLWASGILLIVFGGLALGSPDTIVNLLDLISGVSNVTNLISIYPLFEGMAIFMIVLGSLLFLFGGVGCHGAFRMHKRMIMNYWLLLILGVLTEIALICYGALFPPSMNTWVQDELYYSLNSTFQPVSINAAGTIIYSSNLSANSWEHLQAQTHCCGSFGPGDYNHFNWTQVTPLNSVPPTCCISSLPTGSTPIITSQLNSACLNGSASDYYTTGCWFNVINMVWQFDYIAIIIASCLMATQLLGIGLTVHIWHKMVREDGHI